MSNNSFVKRLKFWRAERPDEWTMDEFIWDAKKLEQERNELAAQVELLRGSDGEVEPVGYLHKIPNRIPVFFEIKEEASIQGYDVFPVYTTPSALKAQWQAEAARDGFIRGYFYSRQYGFQFEEELEAAADEYVKGFIKRSQEAASDE